MNLSKKQAEFWAALIIICTIVAVLILLIDFSIKTAILQESTKLRLMIEEWERAGGFDRKANTTGATNDAPIDSPNAGSLLVAEPTGMETGSSPNGSAAPDLPSEEVKPKPSRQARNRRIPQGDK